MGADRNQWQYPKNVGGKVIGWRSDGKGMENKDWVSPADLDGKQDHSANLDTLAEITPGTTGQAILADQTVDDVYTSLTTAIWDSAVTRTMKERATYVAYSGDFDVDPTGGNDSTTAAQAMANEDSARSEFGPGTFSITNTIKITRLSGFEGRGKQIRGAGKRRTTIQNTTTAAPLIVFGDAVSDLDAIDCRLSDMSLTGNTLTTEGVAILGDDDDFGGLGAQSSRGIILERLRVTDCGAGPSYRWSAWKGRMDACEAEGSLRGVDIGQQVYSLLATGFYNIDSVNEAVYLANGLAGSKSNAIQFIGSVLQGCGAGGQMINIGGGATVIFDGTYMENPSTGCTAAFRVGSTARNVRISNTNFSKGTGPTIDFVETACVATTISHAAFYGDVLSYAKVTGTSRRVIVDQIDQVTGSVTTAIDISGATTPIVHARGLPSTGARLPTSVEIGSNSLTINDRATGSPESAVTAPPGSYVGVRSGSEAGGWLKLSGSGNTGYGYIQTVRSGNTASRPAHRAGLMYFDTTLAKPIWSDGTNWKDATGTTV